MNDPIIDSLKFELEGFTILTLYPRRTRKKHVGGSTEDAREGEDARVIEERRPSSKVQSSRGHVSDQVE